MKKSIKEFIVGDEIKCLDRKVTILDIIEPKESFIPFLSVKERLYKINDVCGKVLYVTEQELADYLENFNYVLTHNCSARFVCGRVGTVASLMALGNSLGTTIDGKHLGEGLVSFNGAIDSIQYYYADPKFIKSWFEIRGLDELGYPKDGGYKTVVEKEELSGVEDIDFNSETNTFKFQDYEKTIDNTKEQKFEEL